MSSNRICLWIYQSIYCLVVFDHEHFSTEFQKCKCLWLCKCNHAFWNVHFKLYSHTHTHTHNDTKLHTRAFRRIKMVNVENRIDVKTKNGLTIFSSSQNYSVCKFVVTHFLLDLVLFVRVRIRCTWSNEQPNNGSKEI